MNNFLTTKIHVFLYSERNVKTIKKRGNLVSLIVSYVESVDKVHILLYILKVRSVVKLDWLSLV